MAPAERVGRAGYRAGDQDSSAEETVRVRQRESIWEEVLKLDAVTYVCVQKKGGLRTCVLHTQLGKECPVSYDLSL